MKTPILFTLFVITRICATAQANPAPTASCNTPQHRAFNFWIGTWSVTNPQGKPAGKNEIRVMQDGCLLQENWTSANGVYKGTSYNYYNAFTGQWNQTWVDNQGGTLLLTGGIENGNMILSGKSKNIQGQWQLDRITWTPHPQGTLQQVWEVSADEGKTWSKIFDGLYQRSQ